MADVLETAKTIFQSVMYEHKLPPWEIRKLFYTQMLGYGILFGAAITKVPQIITMLKSRSAEGMSAAMFELETYTLLVAAAHGFVMQLPFNAYGEAVIIAVQNIIIMWLLYSYSKTAMTRRLFVFALYGAIAVTVLTGKMPVLAVKALYEVNNLFGMASRLPQIYRNHKAKSTGELSRFTFISSFGGSIIRLYTTIQNKGGATMLRTYILSIVLNGAILSQFQLYTKKTGSKKAAKDAAASSKAKPKESKKTK